MTKLWIAGGVSIGLVTLLTFLGGQALERPMGHFYLYIGVLAVLMVLVGNGHGWARWVVSAVLAFFGGESLLGGGIEGVVIAGVFAVCAVVFFRYRPGVGRGSTAGGDSSRSVAGLLLLFVLSGCGQDPDPVPVTVWRDSAGVRIAESDPALAPACSLATEARTRIGTASGDPMQELFRVFGAGLLSTGEIAVANQGSHEVRIYDGQGRFQRGFGREGDGPGEFRTMFGLWILPGDTLWIGDYRPWRYQVYTADGQWVRTVQPEPMWRNPPREWGMLDGGRAVLGQHVRHTPDRSFPQTWVRIILYDSQGMPEDTLGEFPYGRRGRTVDDPRSLITYPFFESSTELAAAGSRMALGPGSEPSVSLFEGDMVDPALIIRWDAGDLTVTPADVDAEKERIREQYAELSPRVRQMGEDLVRDERPAAETFPAYVGLMFGTDGALWISEYPRPGLETRHRLIFEPDGRLRCRLAASPGLELYEVGSDYVLAKEQDELGVETVALYDLVQADP